MKKVLFVAREAAVWEVEERQLHDKHQFLKSQLKDNFFLQRSQMLLRHQKVTKCYFLRRRFELPVIF